MKSFIITYRINGTTEYESFSGTSFAHVGNAFLDAFPTAELLHIQALT